VFDRELNYIFGTLRRLGAPRSDVDDLIQDVFVALYTNWQTIDTSRPIRPWLFGVAFRVVRTRRRMRAREIPIENLDSIDEADGAEGQLQGFEATVLLKAALERVPSERRSVVVMHDLDGIEIIDIARQLSMTKFGVYARLYKGRKELASALRQMWKGRGSK
jgi:RNA polymerase sigma-70 factor (ECF subfamily)